MVGQLAPRTVEPDGETAPVLIFTDAAYEENVATWGIVVIDMISNTRTALGGEIPRALVEAWHELGSQQVITLAEAFAVLLARISFRSLLTKRRVIFWIDNEGARYSLIKGVSQTLALLQIVQLFHSCSEADNCLPWIERVPSKSNIADLPSRNQTAEALEIIHGQEWQSELPVDKVADLCRNFQSLPSLLQHGIVHGNELFEPMIGVAHDFESGDNPGHATTSGNLPG